MKFKYRLIFFLIGVAGMIFMFLQFPDDIPWEELFSLNTVYLFIGLFVLWFIIYTVHAISYLVILGEERKNISFFSMLRICITGFALNNVTPAGLIGGEPYRIMELKRFCSIEKSSSSTLTFSLFYFIGHVILWVATVIIYFAYGCPGELYITIVLAISGVACSTIVLLFFLSKRKGFVFPFMRFLTKIPFLKKFMTGVVEKNKNQYIEIDNNIRAFRCERKKFYIVLILQVLSRLLEAVEYLALVCYFGAKINYLNALVIFGTASLIGNILFIIPMQAGTREGGLFIALAFFGVLEYVGTMASIVYRVREFICIFVGIVLILINKKKNSEKITFSDFTGDKPKTEQQKQ